MNDQQQFIFVNPEFLGYWSYQIDNGKRHMLGEDDVYPWVKKFIRDPKERTKAVDIISRNQPFILILERQKVKELHPQKETDSEHRKKILDDLSNVSRGMEGRGEVFETIGRTPDRYSSGIREDALDRRLKRQVRSDISSSRL